MESHNLPLAVCIGGFSPVAKTMGTAFLSFAPLMRLFNEGFSKVTKSIEPLHLINGVVLYDMRLHRC